VGHFHRLWKEWAIPTLNHIFEISEFKNGYKNGFPN